MTTLESEGSTSGACGRVEGACDLDREIFAYMRGELAQK